MKKAKPRKREVAKFPAIDAEFEWSNAGWAQTFLPRVRLAVVTLQRDDKALEEVLASLIKDGMITDLLEGWLDTAEHLDGVTKMLNCAMARSSMVLKRMGYESAKPHGGGAA